MKYTYIISIILSSFFTYKSVSANIYPQQYAFFIPGGAFQQNQKVQDIRLMRPRYAPTENGSQETSSYTKEQSAASSTNKTTTSRKTITSQKASSSPQNISQTSLKSRKKSILPIARENSITVQKIKALPQQNTKQSAPSTNIVFQDETDKAAAPSSAEVNEKLEQYRLDDNIKIASPQDTSPQKPILSPLEELKQKSLSSLLNEIPYPDPSQPKFKQLYSSYGMELRVYQRRGKFPSNYEQEETLAKANSIKRFEVK